MSLGLESAQSSIINDLELVSALHHMDKSGSDSLLQHQQHQEPLEESLRTMICVCATITIVFYTIRASLQPLCKRWNIPSHQNKIQIAYQMTNLCVNLCLGLYGIYHYNATVPRMSSLPVTHRIVGFHQYNTFAWTQIGYNLWSLPVGYFLVGESKAMLGHHVATICVSLISALSTFGFRYYTPFFFGLIEISSVPLSIMNFCKKNKEWTKKHCPFLGEIIRPIFAIMFLTTRVFMWTPNIYDVLRSSFMLLLSSSSFLTKLVLGLFIVCVAFLTSLQYYWGWLITKGILKLLEGLKVKKVKEVNAD